LVLVVAIPVVVVYTVHRHLLRLTDNVRYYLLTTPNHALHRCPLNQLHKTADDVFVERRWATHAAKKSPADEARLFLFLFAGIPLLTCFLSIWVGKVGIIVWLGALLIRGLRGIVVIYIGTLVIVWVNVFVFGLLLSI
jgi:hypothetical protein